MVPRAGTRRSSPSISAGRSRADSVTITDPRRYGSSEPPQPLLQHAGEPQGRSALVAALRTLAIEGRDRDIGGLLAAAPSAEVYRQGWLALCEAVEKPPAEDGAATRVFAFPWVIVCGASAEATLPCVLPHPDALVKVLEEKGVFGGSRNLGIGNALVASGSLEQLAPSEVLRWPQQPGLRDMPPAPIQLTRGAEEVHVRFLLGAAVTASTVPGVLETGANIGAWGTPALKSMAAQLATAGVQILPMPRPPAGFYSAAFAGRRAGIEAAFNLFMSNAVRRFRSSVGDPQVAISAHASGELRVTLFTPLDDTLVEGFRWPLHPADDLAELEQTLNGMIWDCRLSDPHIVPGVQPDYSSTGAVLFPTVPTSGR